MATIAQDSFSESVNTALSSHTPSPTGTSWTLEAAQFQVIGATDRVQHNQNAIHRAREGTTIGADRMDVSADVAVAGANIRISGVCARMSTDNYINQYEAYLQYLNVSQQNVLLFKNVGGTRTQLGSTATITLAQNAFCTLKLSIGTGTQEVFIDGTSVITATEADSTLSGRTYAGIIMNGNNSSNANMDNFLSESVGSITSKSASDTLAVALTDSATIQILTLKSAADTTAVALTDPLPAITLTTIQKAATDTLSATLTEPLPTVVIGSAPIAIPATDTLNVRLTDLPSVLRPFAATDTLSVQIPSEGTTLVQNTPGDVTPTQAALVWRLTSGDTARLPNLASRDLEL